MCMGEREIEGGRAGADAGYVNDRLEKERAG